MKKKTPHSGKKINLIFFFLLKIHLKDGNKVQLVPPGGFNRKQLRLWTVDYKQLLSTYIFFISFLKKLFFFLNIAKQCFLARQSEGEKNLSF